MLHRGTLLPGNARPMPSRVYYKKEKARGSCPRALHAEAQGRAPRVGAPRDVSSDPLRAGLPVVAGRDAAVVPGPLDLLVGQGDLLVLGELDEIRVADVRLAEVVGGDVRVGQLDRVVLHLGA